MRFSAVGHRSLSCSNRSSRVSSRVSRSGFAHPSWHLGAKGFQARQDRGGPLLHLDSAVPCPGSQADVSCLLPGSLEGRGAGAPSRSTARSSLLDRAEPGFLTDPEPGSQELPDGPLEPWGSDTGCPSLALREEVDNIFPDFFPC